MPAHRNLPPGLGRIVWVPMTDARGITKRRTALVLTVPEDSATEGTVDVMAISSTFPEPIPPDCVELEHHPQGRCRTRLTRRCVAVCRWVERIALSDVPPWDVTDGVVAGAKMTEILRILEETLD